MRQHHATQRSRALHDAIRNRCDSQQLTAPSCEQTDGGIEVRATNRGKHCDQCEQGPRSRQRVGQQRKAVVATGALRHDAAANDSQQQQRCAHRFRRETAREWVTHCTNTGQEARSCNKCFGSNSTSVLVSSTTAVTQ